MASAIAGRRGRGSVFSVALALAACALVARCPLAFLSAVGRGARPRAPCRTRRTRLAARGGEAFTAAFEVGDKVTGQSPDDGMWHAGRIQGASDDGTWVVGWDDPGGGPETNNLSESLIKKIFVFKGYGVGDDCRAVSPDDERWHPGTVAEILGEDKIRVKWDDPDVGDETDDVDAESMKRVRVKRDYKEGEDVIARSPDDNNMYEAKVIKQNEDGTFQVKWADPDDGPEESRVSPKAMMIPPIPFGYLEIGQKYKGTVVNIVDFGAFVDIGTYKPGLLHISRISEDRVDDVRDILEEGREVDVWISGILADDEKFGLTMVEGLKDPLRKPSADLTPFEGISPEEWHDGEVLRLAPFGAFVQVTLESGEEGSGLIHITQLSDTLVSDIESVVEIGQKVRVRVLSVDVEKNRMSLSMGDGSSNLPERGPWARALSRASSRPRGLPVR